MRSFKYLLLALLILLGAAILQAMKFPQGSTGRIEGFVLDEKGAPIARVSVQAFNIMHAGVSTASAQANGFYRIVHHERPQSRHSRPSDLRAEKQRSNRHGFRVKPVKISHLKTTLLPR
jgi:hypothetical protein